MLARLTWYELKKTCGGRFFPLALAVLLGVNIILQWGTKDWLEIQSLVRQGQEVSQEEYGTFWRAMATVRRSTQMMKENYALFENLSPQEREAFEAEMKSRYGEDIFTVFDIAPTEEMMAQPGWLGGVLSDYSCLITYRDLLTRNAGIAAARTEIVERAKSYGREALREGDNYNIRRNQQLIRAYSRPVGQVTTVLRHWNRFLLESPDMLLVFLMLLLACCGSFAGELDGGTWLLLHTSRHGKSATLWAKLLSGWCLAAGLTLLFRLTSLGAVWFSGGLLGANQPIQSLGQLLRCPYGWSVWQYALIALLCQIFSALVLATLLLAVSAVSPSSLIAYGAGVLVLGAGLALGYASPGSPLLRGPLFGAQPLPYFETWYTCDLLGFPVKWLWVQTGLWLLLSGLAVFAAHRVYHRRRRAV